MLEGTVTYSGGSPSGQVDLEKGIKSNQCKGISAKTCIITLLSVYAFCLLILFLCIGFKIVCAYLSQMKDDFVTLNRRQG